MSKRATQIACIGGFLGAGKTTAIVRAGVELKQRGLNVGIITNDQGSHLVDTALMRDFGFPTEEVAGGCFCCNFPRFIQHARDLLEHHKPDIILAEPVGSCTDLVRSVYLRLRRYQAQFEVLPLTIVVEPARLRQFTKSTMGFDESVRYLFSQQLAEADLVLLNKSDLVDPGEINEFRQQLSDFAGDVPVLPVSAKTGAGISEWVEKLLTETTGNRALQVDYDIYGQAEATLGWLNANLDLTSGAKFSPGDVGEALVRKIQLACASQGKTIAHLKIMFVTDAGNNWIALTDENGRATWGKDQILAPTRSVSAIVNLRASSDPEELKQILIESLQGVTRERNIDGKLLDVQSFAPSPPTPPDDIHIPHQA
jgi:G3E family GTPase